MVKERDKVERKLSTTYSLGRDEPASKSQSLLPLYNGKGKSYSFQGSKKESVTIFHTLTDPSSQGSSSGGGSSSSSNNSSSSREPSWHYFGDKESVVKAKGGIEEVGPSSSRVVCQSGGPLENLESPASGSKGYTNPLYVEHPRLGNELREMQMDGKEEELAMEPMKQGANRGVWLKRRTLSSNYNN